MSNESDDTGLCISKRPKTKLQTSKNASSTEKTQTDNEDDTTAMKGKTENTTTSIDNKKAAKRGRESDEESSITSDEETMCKKRVRKDSEEDLRPKKKVSVEARKRREAARSAVEKKKAILDSDSDCESETQLDTYKSSIASNKSDVDISSKGRLLDSGNEENSQQKCEDSVVKANKVCSKKNEESSSAYNSDSEGNKARKISQGKVFKSSKNNSEYGDSTEDETVSVNAPEKKSVHSINNSEDEAGHTSSDWEDRKCAKLANVKLKKTEKCNYGNDTRYSGSEVEDASDSDKKILSKISEVGLNKHISKEVKTNTIDSIKNNAKSSDASESVLKQKASSPRKRDKVDAENHQKSSKSLVSSDADSDDIPLAISKKNTNKTETVEKSSDSDRPLHVSKSGASKKVPFGCSDAESDDIPLTKSKKNTNKTETVEKSSDGDRPLHVSKSGASKKVPFGCSDAESDDIPLTKSKKNTNKTETVEKSSDGDRPLHVSKSGASKKVPFGRKVQLSSDESDSQCKEPAKKTKQTSKEPCYNKQKSNKAISLQDNISSSSDDTSDDDSAQRKTVHKKAKKKFVSNLQGREKKNTPSSSYDNDSPCKRSKSAENEVKSKTSETLFTKSSDSDQNSGKIQKEDKLNSRKLNEGAKYDNKRKLSLQGICNELNKSSEDSDVPIKVGNIAKTGKKFSCKTEKRGEFESENESDADESHKPLGNEKLKKEVTSNSDDSEGTSVTSKDKNLQEDSVSNYQDGEETNIKSEQKFSKSEVSDSSSDSDEPLKGKSKLSKKLVGKKSKRAESSDHAIDSNCDVERKKERKTIGKWEVRINSYKKYINAAGIRIKNYASFWEGCKNDKQRADKLQKLLEDNGIKGRPSLQKCKKIREKLERKREIEELDLNNIIEDDGELKGRYRSRRSRGEDNKARTSSNVTISKEAAEKAAEIKQRFSRIKDLIDSDSSSD